VKLGQDNERIKLLLFVVSLLWGVACCVYGFRAVLRMKEEYFREVFMITFLNSEMIVKNKRVESFLQFIAKNTFT
jgi:hypothetical protein